MRNGRSRACSEQAAQSSPRPLWALSIISKPPSAPTTTTTASSSSTPLPRPPRPVVVSGNSGWQRRRRRRLEGPPPKPPHLMPAGVRVCGPRAQMSSQGAPKCRVRQISLFFLSSFSGPPHALRGAQNRSELWPRRRRQARRAEQEAKALATGAEQRAGKRSTGSSG